MPGLSFLAKKSWHTTNLDNVERVWLAEQKDQQEKKKLADLQKQLQEERQIQELRQLQVQSGHKVKTVDTSLDWMYQGPSADIQKQQSSEEYLLGKIFKPKDDGKSENISQQKTEAVWLNKVSSKNDSFTRVHEDPFLFIKQEEQRKRNSVINNPIKMDRIRNKITQELQQVEEERKLKKQMKRERKEKKKESKRKKDDKHTRTRHSDESSESDGGNAPSHTTRSVEQRSRGRSDSRDQRGQSADMTSMHDGRHLSEYDRKGTEPTREHHRDRLDGDGRVSFNRMGDNRLERGRSSDRKRRSRSEESDDEYTRYRSSKHSRHSPENDRRDDSSIPREKSGPIHQHSDKNRNNSSRGSHNHNSHADTSGDDDSRHGRQKSPPKYGLISKNKNTNGSAGGDANYLGPNLDLLQRKVDKEQQEREQRNNRSRANVKTLSEEERARRVREMQQDADRYDSSRIDRQQAHDQPQGRSSGAAEHSGKAVFIDSMRKEVYGGSSSAGISMKERLDQNKHYRQSSADMERDGYRKN